ncbi:pyridoxamine 5'-phosphate oxidase family protein [Maribacter litopenaei]|uniref:Pyridoxamine 5'-phosphate oxidase family protein n=1 Tax=Maribacter litopenaei TaxID=2976127 RepID=A0ABY5Y579_9FLAO|nr:pyridoxamine 5'-phosphate oxidase family protein [Maribacter litopenaei]UWX54018.1 pyridoxamine 5'-phosphate oxidase family protein [Maribacter litopenaei]
MMDIFWNELQEELKRGTTEKRHPFRFGTFGTVGIDKLPRLRTIVLRHVYENGYLSFYTDKRSKKVIHITENPNVSLLFYHPEKLLQVKIEGLASIVTDEHKLQTMWRDIPESNKKDYTTDNAPGSTLKNPDNLEYLTGDHFFCMIEIEPFRIEYLKLKRPHHIRVAYAKEDNWKGEFLVP